MKKRNLYLILFCLMLALCGCKAGKKSKEDVKVSLYEKFDSDKDYEINFYVHNKSLYNYFPDAVKRFNEKYPKVKVNISFYQESEFIDNVAKSNSGKNKIDAFLFDSSDIEKAYLLGILVNNDNTAYTDEAFSKKSLNACTYKDKMYAYPFAFSTPVMVNNNNISTQIPKTYQEMMDISSTLEIKDDVVFEGILIWDLADINVNYSFMGSYVDICGKNGDDRTKTTIKSDDSKLALETFKQIATFFNVRRDSLKNTDVVSAFSTGHYLYGFMDSENLTELDEKCDGTFSYDINFMPGVKNGEKSSGLSRTLCIGVNPFSDNVEVAKVFADFLCNEDCDNIEKGIGYQSARKNKNGKHSKVYDIYEESTLKARIMDIGDFYLKLDIFFGNILDGDNIEQKLDAMDSYLKRLLK